MIIDLVCWLRCLLSFVQSLLVTCKHLFIPLDLNLVILDNHLLNLLFCENVRIFKYFGQEVVDFASSFTSSENLVHFLVIRLRLHVDLLSHDLLVLFRQLIAGILRSFFG
jgi:hypothetical protein